MLHFPDSRSCLDIFTFHRNNSARQHSQSLSQLLPVLIWPWQDARYLHAHTGHTGRRHLTPTYCHSSPFYKKQKCQMKREKTMDVLNPNRITSFYCSYRNGAGHITPRETVQVLPDRLHTEEKIIHTLQLLQQTVAQNKWNEDPSQVPHLDLTKLVHRTAHRKTVGIGLSESVLG